MRPTRTGDSVFCRSWTIQTGAPGEPGQHFRAATHRRVEVAWDQSGDAYKANHLLREKHRATLEWLLAGYGHVFLIDKAFYV
jgi:hypothetical protein